MRLLALTFFLLILSGKEALFAQHQELGENPALWKEKKDPGSDTSSLLSAFKRGHMQGHFRYFFIVTDNARGYNDYYAHAIGGGIKFETAPFHGFRFGVSGFFAFDIASSDLSKPDPETGQMNRYEIGLFDITNPLNKDDIDRLEELYLQYEKKKTRLRLGRQLLNTPFINLQDGRMRPTEVSGLWVESTALPRIRLQGGFIRKISPRSTVRWYEVGPSIGVYPVGVNPDGTRSGYAGNLESKGILLAGIQKNFPAGLSFKVWNQWVDQLFNSALVQLDWKQSSEEEGNWIAGFQWIQQNAVGDGGNPDPAKTYFPRKGRAASFGLRVGREGKRWNYSLNFNRITSAGRYLMPREWGRDPFFTFLPRERNEGLGDVNALVGKFEYSPPGSRVKFSLAGGYFDLPDVKNFRLNKYGFPSYTQFNLDGRYEFGGWLRGLDAQALLVYKGQAGPVHGEGKYIVNKVNMWQGNLVLNYHF